jgi:uncharacterized membrane protein YkoI
MNAKTRLTILASAGITSLILITAAANAKSERCDEMLSLGSEMQTALSAALLNVPGSVVDIELEREDGQYLWEIEIVDETDRLISVELDGETVELLATEMEDDVVPDLAETLSINEAIGLISTANNGVLTEAELETEDGRAVWEFTAINENKQKTHYHIDAVSGEFI